MPNDTAIEFKNVSERYDLELMIDGKTVRESFLALQDISFAIQKGEAVAIIGPNGSGKSTLLRLIAGLLRPEKGGVKVSGRVGSLLDLTAGFHPELTGRDNLFLTAGLYNFSRDELESKYEQILKFADIGKFINVPVRCYSQGMYVRLAFSLAIHVDPDILLIDDCLAVGDDHFKMKSVDKVLEFRTRGKTIVFVTHDFYLARQVCSRGIYLKAGKIVRDAAIEEAVSCYVKPLEVGKGVYKYIDEDMERKAKEEEARRVLAEERRRAERESRERGYVLSRNPALKVVVAPAKIRILQNDLEITQGYGLQTLFSVGTVDVPSGSAVWKVRKISDDHIVCYLRWPKPRLIFQVWDFKLREDGTVDWEVLLRSREPLAIEDERIELCLRVPSGLLDGDSLGNKARVIYCQNRDGVRLETLLEGQICEVIDDGAGCFKPQFLTIPDRLPSAAPGAGRGRLYFKGRFFFGGKPACSSPYAPVTHRLETGKLAVRFQEGSGQLFWGDKALTVGLGIYTSIYAKGAWYDSQQARWNVQESGSERLMVEGCLPRLPISQLWEVLQTDNCGLMLKIKLKVFKPVLINMQETALMLSEQYQEWGIGDEKKPFGDHFTSDDLFRVCLCAREADGAVSVSAFSGHLPVIMFQPGIMPGHRIIVENTAHIYAVRSRLFHCLRVNKKEGGAVEPGEYTFFQGHINVKEAL